VAAGLVPAAVAVDGLGSTRLPAAFCGLVGLNPSRGRIPWTSDWAINPRLLSNAGPLTTNARDAAILMRVLAGPDGRDLMCRPDAPPDYMAGLGKGLAGLNLAWSDDPFEASARAGPKAAQVIATVRKAANRLAEGGASLDPVTDRLEGAGAAALAILGADRTMATRTEAASDVVTRAKLGRKRAIDWFNALFERYDALVTPTIQYLAPTRQEWADAWADPGYMLTYAAHTAASNLTGFPAISVPAGLVEGMPVGIQFWGPPDSEPLLLRMTEEFLKMEQRQ
jgi:aspartyl-tRNA(Asn)/glutamyl-tRNA(Gln) amidotransferase subunit A